MQFMFETLVSICLFDDPLPVRPFLLRLTFITCFPQRGEYEFSMEKYDISNVHCTC